MKVSNTGIKGVSLYKRGKKYYAEIVINGIRLRKGFYNENEAVAERWHYESLRNMIKGSCKSNKETKDKLNEFNEKYEARIHNVIKGRRK